MKHTQRNIPKEASKAASLLGKRGAGVAKTLTEQERERRREHMRKVQPKRWAKHTAKLIAAALLLLPFVHAYAMPESVLRAQAHQRVDIEFDISNYVEGCKGNSSRECKEEREKVITSIAAYVTSIADNIVFCKRYAEKADPSERPDIEKSIKDYEKDIAWAKEQLKAVGNE